MSIAPPSLPPKPTRGPAVAIPPPLGRPPRRRALPALLALALALAVVLVAMHDEVRYYRVDSGSMRPTLPVGTRVAAEPGLTPRVGEIIAFDAPAGAVPAAPLCGVAGQGAGFASPCGVATPSTSHTVFIKRIVAGPGDLVALRDGHVVRNGRVAQEPFAVACGAAPDCSFPAAVRVPAGAYYVLGDNRATSDDSRFWGPVAADAILGVLVRCHPLQTDCTPLS